MLKATLTLVNDITRVSTHECLIDLALELDSLVVCLQVRATDEDCDGDVAWRSERVTGAYWTDGSDIDVTVREHSPLWDTLLVTQSNVIVELARAWFARERDRSIQHAAVDRAMVRLGLSR